MIQLLGQHLNLNETQKLIQMVFQNYRLQQLLFNTFKNYFQPSTQRQRHDVISTFIRRHSNVMAVV